MTDTTVPTNPQMQRHEMQCRIADGASMIGDALDYCHKHGVRVDEVEAVQSLNEAFELQGLDVMLSDGNFIYTAEGRETQPRYTVGLSQDDLDNVLDALEFARDNEHCELDPDVLGELMDKIAEAE